MRTPPLFLAIFATLVAAAAQESRAATINLRSEAVVSDSIVTLGDVARISAADEGLIEKIEAIALFPSPRGGKTRHVGIREIQDLLYARGVDLSRHEFTGASQVAVSAGLAHDDRETPVSESILRSNSRKAEKAVSDYLEAADPDSAWNVEVELTPADAAALARARRDIRVTGTQRPSTGTHQFELQIDGAEGPKRLTVEAILSKEPSIVVATRALAMGELISPGDVRLAPPGNDNVRGAFHSIEKVIGMELGRSVPEGRPLSNDSVIAPILVESGKVVSVCVRGGGIRIRTTARARQNGALDDVITVENITNRAKYLARVVGHNEVEVCNILSRTR